MLIQFLVPDTSASMLLQQSIQCVNIRWIALLLHYFTKAGDLGLHNSVRTQSLSVIAIWSLLRRELDSSEIRWRRDRADTRAGCACHGQLCLLAVQELCPVCSAMMTSFGCGEGCFYLSCLLLRTASKRISQHPRTPSRYCLVRGRMYQPYALASEKTVRLELFDKDKTL